MSAGEDLLLRNVEIDGRAGMDVLIAKGRVAAIGPNLPRTAPELEGGGGALIPGLIDHHIHLLAFAAEAGSISVAPDSTPDRAAFEAVLRRAGASGAGQDWVRATGYHDCIAGSLDRDMLDRLAPDRPVRVQQRTGSLWVLNSAALDRVLEGEVPACVERDAAGRPTGRIWRGDAWLRRRLKSDPPSLAGIGERLARWGITGVTDASVSTGPEEAALIADAVRAGALPQRVTLMSGGALEAPVDEAFAVGPLKILLDEHDLPDLDELLERMREARRWKRRIAVHCATAVELAFTLAAFEELGGSGDDRIEHGSVIPDTAIAAIARLGLTVVTQPGFIHERGDHYAQEIEPEEHDTLYRCGSLLRAGIKVAGSSDAPYTSGDPWRAMATAVRRLTREGRMLGQAERVDPIAALNLFLGAASDPGGPARRIETGAADDLCLLDRPLGHCLADFPSDAVAATIVGGRISYRRS